MRLSTGLALSASYLAMSGSLLVWAQQCLNPVFFQFGLDVGDGEVRRYCLGPEGYSTQTSTRTVVSWTATVSVTATFIRPLPSALVTVTRMTTVAISTVIETRTFARLPVQTITTTNFAMPAPTKLVADRKGWNPWYNHWGQLSDADKNEACSCVTASINTTTTAITSSIIIPVATQIIAATCTSTVLVTLAMQVVTSTTFITKMLDCTPPASAPLPTVTVTRSPNCVPQDHPAYPGFGSFLKLWGAAYFNTCGTINPWFQYWGYTINNPPPYREPWVAYRSFTAADATECCTACYATQDCFLSRFNGKTGECVYGARITRPDSNTLPAPPATCPVAMTPVFFHDQPGDWGLMQGPCSFTFCSDTIDLKRAQRDEVLTPLRQLDPRFIIASAEVGWLAVLVEMDYKQNLYENPNLDYPWDYVPMCKMVKYGESSDFICVTPSGW